MSRKLLSEVRDLVILIALGFAMTWFGLSCRNCQEDSRKLIIMGTYTAVLWILLWKGNEHLGNVISRWISWTVYPVRRFVVGFTVTILYTLFAMYALTAIYEQTLRVTFSQGVWTSVVITLVISLFMHAKAFLANWRKASIQVERFQKESMTARFEALKSQVNPHFLFNSLNVLTNLVYDDTGKAVDFIDELSTVYRYVLDTREKELVSLSEEMAFVESYLYLQRIRFGEKLRVHVDVSFSGWRVAPLALQMLLENAIKHNVISEDEPLNIYMLCENDYLVVRNDLRKKTSLGEHSSGIGLDNICKRYQMLTSRDVVVAADERYFTVKIPLLTAEETPNVNV
jgi:sensor histidine kinase YesM